MSDFPCKVHVHPAWVPSERPPLCFVHGGYSNSRCWQENFIPHFQAQGHDCYAVDLPGHGESPGREALNGFGLDDYAVALGEALAALRPPQPPVLVGHSMGCLVVERYLGTLPELALRGAAFLAPVPPSGTLGSASRLALGFPGFFEELPRAISGTGDDRTLAVMAAVYFSPEVAPEDTARYLPMLGPESDQAVAEMVTAPLRRSARRPRLPVVVMGGSADQVFPPSMLYFTASIWDAGTMVVEGAGHMLMLDPQWQEAARKLQEWVGSLG